MVLIAASLTKYLHGVIGDIQIFLVNSLMGYGIWFALGMCLTTVDVEIKFQCRKGCLVGIGLAGIFLICSTLITLLGVKLYAVSFVMGIFGSVSTILVFMNIPDGSLLMKIVQYLSRYTMPIYLMHTIFAAGLRSVLLKLGISSVEIHVILGIGISFAGPILAAEIMKRTKLDVLLYPGRYIKIATKQR